MIKNVWLALCITLFSFTATAAPDSFVELAAEKSGVVVNISTTTKPKEIEADQFSPFGGFSGQFQGTPFEDLFSEFFRSFPPMQSMPRESLGSGLVISADGFIVTNDHVVNGADEIIVKFDEGHAELTAELIGRDEKNDLALLKVKTDEDLAHAPLDGDTAVQVGEWVIAIGNPFGLGGSVSAGIISAQGRNIGLGPYDDFIQTDAAINPGNSGGPLFNMDGEVVGINTAIISRSGGYQGIGFAIPVETVALIVNQLKEYGRPIRGWLGVQIQTITPELAEALELDSPAGALVAGVVDDSPAAKAGIRDGDVILTFNGEPIETMDQLPKIVAQTPVDARVPVEVVRGNRRITLQVRIAELEEDVAVSAVEETIENEVPFGLTLGKVTPERQLEFGLSQDAVGVLVLDVKRGSGAWDAQLRPGDIIKQVDRKNVGGLGEAERLLKRAAEAEKATLLLLDRRGDTLFVAVKP